MFNDFVAAIMQRAEAQLKWTTSGSYTGDWRKDIARARSILDQTEFSCVAIETALKTNMPVKQIPDAANKPAEP